MTQSDAQRKSIQLSVEKGQQAWREGKSSNQNPYPAISPNHDAWEQGWNIERNLETS